MTRCACGAATQGQRRECSACHYKRRPKISCEQCGESTGFVVGDRRAPGLCKACKRHGTRTSYNAHGCRCEACRQAATESQRRYTSKKRSQFVEPVDAARVFELDGWRCYLCGERVLTSVPPNHALYPTLDHVVPLSKGGTHERSNVRCAHRSCNGGKRERGGGEQFALPL